jgi:hypothetical protein
MTVIGLVADVKHVSAREEPGPEIYVPYTQKPWPSMLTMHIAMRTKAEPTSMTEAVRVAIRAVDPELPIARVATLDTIVNDAMAQSHFSMLLVAGFGGLALLLACVGLYGAVSFSVTSRTQDRRPCRAGGAASPDHWAVVEPMREDHQPGHRHRCGAGAASHEGDLWISLWRRGDRPGDVWRGLYSVAVRRAARLLRTGLACHPYRCADGDARRVACWC